MVLPIVLDSSRGRRIAKISDAKLTFYFMLLALAVYELTPRILVTRDTLPSSLWALNVLENHTRYFDNLRDSSNPIISGYFPFVQTANGHLSTIYPFGVGLITLPFYAIADLGLRLAGISVDLNDAAFEPLRQRLETAAALIAAICVGLYFRALTRMFAPEWPCSRRGSSPLPRACGRAAPLIYGNKGVLIYSSLQRCS